MLMSVITGDAVTMELVPVQFWQDRNKSQLLASHTIVWTHENTAHSGGNG